MLWDGCYWDLKGHLKYGYEWKGHRDDGYQIRAIYLKREQCNGKIPNSIIKVGRKNETTNTYLYFILKILWILKIWEPNLFVDYEPIHNSNS